MTHRPGGQLEESLDAYADGLMDQEQRSAFEGKMAEQPALRAELQQQREIDAALNRLLAPPSAEDLSTIVETARQHQVSEAATAARPGRFRFPTALRRFAVAASLALTVLGAWMIWDILGPATAPLDPYAPQAYRSMETVYRDEIAAGFEPTWVCRTDDEFAHTFARQLGQPLLLSELPEDVAALGLSYSNTISPRTVLLLADVAGEPVLVFIDRTDADDERSLPAGKGVHLHRREVGDLVLYELSPFEKRRVIGHFFNPDDEAGE